MIAVWILAGFAAGYLIAIAGRKRTPKSKNIKPKTSSRFESQGAVMWYLD